MISTKIVKLPYIHSLPVRTKTLNYNYFLEVTLFNKSFYLSSIQGFHELSLSEIDFKIKYFFSNYNLNFENIDYTSKFFNTINLVDDFLESIEGEALFHIECLLYGIKPKITSPILCNQLYSSQKSIIDNANSLCLKIKIRPSSTITNQTIFIMNEIHKLNPKTIFRLDGNRSFELKELIDFTRELEAQLNPNIFLKIDYLEEPLKNFYETYLYLKRAKLIIAIDESALIYLNSPLLESQTPMVIKASFFGLSTIMNWLKTEIRKQRRIIISSSYEHPSIMPALYLLAETADLSGSTEFHGLENYFA